MISSLTLLGFVYREIVRMQERSLSWAGSCVEKYSKARQPAHLPHRLPEHPEVVWIIGWLSKDFRSKL